MRTLAYAALAALALPAAAAADPGLAGAPAMPPHAGGPMGGHMGPPPGTTWHGPPPGMHRPPMGGGHHFTFRRVQRGGFVPPFFWGPRFQVRNWGLYGFPAPSAGGRWIRYYDDALLIDQYGRVMDGRYGWDWDRYGEAWDYDGPAPGYRGEWADRGPPPPPPGYDGPPPAYEEGPPPPPGAMCGNPCVRTFVMHRGAGAPPPPPPPAYGYGYGYGCGCGPVVVTETVVTTPPVVETRTYTTYETRWVKVKPRKVYRRPAPPPPGERG